MKDKKITLPTKTPDILRRKIRQDNKAFKPTDDSLKYSVATVQ